MTRGELTTAVLERFGVSSSRTSFVAQVQGHLNRGYVREVVTLGLLLSETSVVLTAGSQVITLPADFGRVETFRLGYRIMVERTLAGSLLGDAQEALASSASAGAPRWYTYFPPDRLRVGPAPEESETTGSLVYRAKPAEMDDDLDVPTAIPSHYHDILIEHVVWRMAPNQEEPGMGQDALAELQRLRTELRDEIAQAAGTSTTRIRRRRYG